MSKIEETVLALDGDSLKSLIDALMNQGRLTVVYRKRPNYVRMFCSERGLTTSIDPNGKGDGLYIEVDD